MAGTLSQRRPELGQLLILGACALLLVSATVLLYALLRSPQVVFLTPGTEASWITYPLPISADSFPSDRANPPVYVFSKRFEAPGGQASARLEARGLREVTLILNGQPLSITTPPESWRDAIEVDLGSRLRVGRNEIRAEVRNPAGPPLLQLAIQGEDLDLRADRSWQVARADRRAVPARLAMDTLGLPEAHTLPGPGELLASRAATLLALFAACVALYLLASRFLPEAWHRRIPLFTVLAVSLLWMLIFAAKTSQLALTTGFDSIQHLEYVDFLIRERSLPLASEGWSMFHPPAFYLATAAIASLLGVAQDADLARWVYRIVPFLSGLGNVWVGYFLARRLFGGDVLRTTLAVGAVGLLPMNIYMAAYVSNESLASFWVSVALWISCGLLLGRGAPKSHLALLALALGLGLLTKYTALLVVPIALAFLVVKLWLLDRRSLLRSAWVGGLLIAGVGLLAGWYYARSWVHFGHPLVLNFDVGWHWWQLPGFHTLAYFTSFGESLRHPFFAGFHSFWDGIYSTLWGDGLAGGRIHPRALIEVWNYDYMTIAYWLAFPATLLIIAGLARTASLCFRHSSPRHRLAFAFIATVIYAVGFSQISYAVRYPSYVTSKAFYGLPAVVFFGIVLALGLAAIPEKLPEGHFRPVLLAVYYGWLGTLAAVLALSFLG